MFHQGPSLWRVWGHSVSHNYTICGYFRQSFPVRIFSKHLWIEPRTSCVLREHPTTRLPCLLTSCWKPWDLNVSMFWHILYNLHHVYIFFYRRLGSKWHLYCLISCCHIFLISAIISSIFLILMYFKSINWPKSMPKIMISYLFVDYNY